MPDSTSIASDTVAARKTTNAATTATNVIVRLTISRRRRQAGAARDGVHHEEHPVQQAPHRERPGRAVPQPAQEHHDQQVAQRLGPAAARAAQRDEQVVAQEERQRHVPAPPELGDVHRLERRVEVLGEAEAEQERQPDGHVGVAGEVEVQLQRVAERRAPGRDQPERVVPGEQRVDRRRDLVGEQQLLREAAGEEEDARRGEPRRQPRRQPGELRLDVGVAHDRAGDEVREHRHERRVVHDVLRRPAHAAVHVDRVRHRVEGVERDADREHDVDDRDVGVGAQRGARCRSASRGRSPRT